MVQLKHIKSRELNQELDTQIKKNRRGIGPSDALKKIMKRPDNKNWRLNSTIVNSDKYREGWEKAFNK